MDGGTPKLEIINDLLAALNYKQLYFDENGVAITIPYVSPSNRAAEYTYEDNADSVIFPEVEETLDHSLFLDAAVRKSKWSLSIGTVTFKCFSSA